MNVLTKAQIEAKIKEVFEGCDYGDDPDTVKVTILPDGYDIVMHSMYKSPNLSFAILLKLAEFFGTQNLTPSSQYAISGCESCDYGSEYGFTLEVRS